MQPDEYLKLAAVEDQMWYFRALHAHVARVLGAHLGERAAVLDAGCGTGGLIRRLAARWPAWRWTGLDSSPLAIELARERCGSSAEVCPGDVAKLPFGEAAFDAVVSADVLYQVDDDVAALREFYRVLRPGGVIVLNLPAYQWLWSYHDDAVQSRRRYARRELLAKLRAAGFAATHATHWNTLPFPLVVLRRKLLPAPHGGSDVRFYPPLVEAAFNGMMGLERAWLRLAGPLPFGSSILALAKKPHQQ